MARAIRSIRHPRRKSARRPRRPDARLRLRRATIVLVIAIGLAVVALLDRSGRLASPQADEVRYQRVHTVVVRVIDGDTFEVAIADQRESRPTTKVRLLGVDAPEMGRGGAGAEPLAHEAARMIESMTRVGGIVLTVEPSRSRDRYDRLLAHAAVGAAGGESLAAALVRNGLARAERRWPHRDLHLLIRLEEQAKRDEFGIWRGRPG